MAKPRGGLTAWFGKGKKGDWVNIGVRSIQHKRFHRTKCVIL